MKNGHSVIQAGALYINPDFLFSFNPHISLVTVLSGFYFIYFGQIYYLFLTFQKTLSKDQKGG